MAEVVCPVCEDEIVLAAGQEFVVDQTLVCDGCSHQLTVITVKDNGEVEFEDDGYVGPEDEDEEEEDEDLEDDVTA